MSEEIANGAHGVIALPDEEAQMQLTLQGEQLYIDRDELPFRYTGERFKSYHPDRYKVAVKLLAAGQFSHRSIAKFVHADYRTIREIGFTCIKDIEVQREILREKFFVGMMVLGDKAIELADKAQKPAEAAIPMGIMKDAYLQVGGLPTATIDVNHKFDFAGELSRLHQEAEEKIKQVLGKVIEPEDGAHGVIALPAEGTA
jgi:hypothetical protein